MTSFSSLLLPRETPVAAPSPAAAAAPHIARQLRLALAMRDWVDPKRLLPATLTPAEQASVLDAVAPDVQVALSEHPGKWFLRDQERRRLLTTASVTELENAVSAIDRDDAADPVRTALALRRRPVPADLTPYSSDELTALGSTFVWLDPNLPWQGEARSFWAELDDPEGVKQRVVSTLARRRRRDDVDRMTSAPLRGRGSQLDQLVEWATRPAGKTGRGEFLYLSGIGGAGKSTLFAHLERRLWAASEPPLLVHIDCDTPGFDPTDPVALDLSLFPQLAAALPSAAANLMQRATDLGRATRATDADYVRRSGRRGNRRRRRKAEADLAVDSFTALESASTQKLAERSSISDNALSQLGNRTLVLLFDTAELMLARAAVDTSTEVAGTTDWFASLTGLMNGHDVRVLMAGRNAPTDQEVKSLTSSVNHLPTWRADKPIVLEDLSQTDAQALLSDLKVEFEVARKAATVLPRTPLILKIAADVYKASEGADREEFVNRLETEKIDSKVARRYLTERIVRHLASPAARPYALAAMVLPRVTEGLLGRVVLPAVDSLPADRKQAKAVYRGLREAGWLVRDEARGRYLTFHPEVRRLALDLMADDPASARLLESVRLGARDYHAGRRQAGDSTFRAYYDLLLGNEVSARTRIDPSLLGAAVEDLPPAQRRRLGPAPGKHSVTTKGAPSAEGWIEYVEGSGRRDGEGDRLVKRGHADAALELYRRPTRPEGLPPTFVLQALADCGHFEGHHIKVDVEAIVAQAASELARGPDTLPNLLRSRIYWLTRFVLMAQPGPLSPGHRSLLGEAASRFSGSGPVLLFPAIASVAEAFDPKGAPIAPDAWFHIQGAIESETRMYLVHHQRGRNLTWQPHIDALFTLQPDWPERAARSQSERVRSIFTRWAGELRSMIFPPGARTGSQLDLNGFLRRLREPVVIELTADTSGEDAIALLRGLTTEFHRPLRAAISRHVASTSARRRLIDVTAGMLAELPLRTRELEEAEWRRRAERDDFAAFGLAIPFIDRARRLPSYCQRLIEAAGSRATGQELARVARNYLAWDRALSAGGSSDWSHLAVGRGPNRRDS